MVQAGRRERAKPRVGDRLGSYVLCRELGEGGMATVFLARRASIAGEESLFAVKCLNPWLCDNARAVEMFLDEARIASRIRHPNVCTVVESGEEAGQYYMVMEYLHGQTLRAVQERMSTQHVHPLHPSQIGVLTGIVAGAAEGLHAAHELRDQHGRLLNVVHRDVSPENIFVTYDGGSKVLDFGVASAVQDAQDAQDARDVVDAQGRVGLVRGKAAYLAPELLFGANIDRRCDVWSLGVVLWELLTGKHLFKPEPGVTTLQSVSLMRIPRVSERAANIPKELDAIVAKALVRTRDERYATTREMGQALIEFNARHGVGTGIAQLAAFLRALFPDQNATTAAHGATSNRGSSD